jgi:hypothetical protein
MSTVRFSLASGNFFQDWSNTGALLNSSTPAAGQAGSTVWDLIASIVGYSGAGLAGVNTDPQTVVADSAAVSLTANSSAAGTAGGVHEIANDTIAFQGSGSANAPSLVIYLDATGREDVTFSCDLKELDGSTVNQQVAVQYRVGGTGNFINLPSAFVSASVFNPAGNQTAHIEVILPPDANNAADLEIRIITTDVTGSDAMIGIDNISVTSEPLVEVSHGSLSIADASVVEGDAGSAALTFTVNRNGGADGEASATWNMNLAETADAADLAPGQALTGTVHFADGQTSATIIVQVGGDVEYEPNETFTVTLAEPLAGGVTLGDAAATGTILNDDPAPPAGDIFINEFHYDDAGTDAGEAIEVAGPAGTSLAGWTLVLYNGNGGGTYGTIALSGVFANQDDGYGTLSFAGPASGIQNGAPDGFALVDPDGNVVQFLSYEGSFTATSGPAAGLTSTDNGVAEEPAVADRFSQQLVGEGAT